jgi:hypothetical protein
MSDEPKKRSPKWIGWAVLALFALYPLALGPINLAYRRTNDPDAKTRIHHSVRVVYWPIDRLTERSKTAYDVVAWYVDLWDIDRSR